MNNHLLAVARAYRALEDIARPVATDPSEASTFALTWLAASRMVLKEKVPGVSTLPALGEIDSWSAVAKAGLPIDGVERCLRKDELSALRVRASAAQVVVELHKAVGGEPWDVLPALRASRNPDTSSIDPSVARLMLDMLDSPVRGLLWIPFDPTGQLAIEALRYGWREVNVTPMLGQVSPMLPLLLAIEYGHPKPDGTVVVHTDRDMDGRPTSSADVVLAVPPMGMSVRGSALERWETRADDNVQRALRSEVWCVQELLYRCGRAVFLLPPGVLFGSGQEKRLRKDLLGGAWENKHLESVVALPPGALPGTNIASALLCVGNQEGDIKMLDLGLHDRSNVRLEAVVEEHRAAILGLNGADEGVRTVSPRDVEKNDYDLTPSKYLMAPVEVSENAVPLKEICDAIKPPLMARDDPQAKEMRELGIPELGRWRPIEEMPEKRVQVRERDAELTLRPNDVVLSIKGSVGKVGVIGALQGQPVVSQSCVGLRLKPKALNKGLTAGYLMAYLRSQEGQAQLERLQKGASIAYISANVLMDSFLVPMPDAALLGQVNEDYAKLCEIEHRIEVLQREAEEIELSNWPMNSGV